MDERQETAGIWIDYWSLDRLAETMRRDNPKDHDIGMLHGGINRHGFRGAVMIDERTQKLQAGHGRITTLLQKREAGEAPPAGVRVEDGAWLVPVLRGEAWRSDADARAYVTLDNQATIAGGWNESLLADFLKATLEDQGNLEGTGFDEGDLDALIASLQMASDEGQEEGGGGAGGEELPASDTQAQIGAYRFDIPRGDYERWLEEIRQSVGFENESVIGEIRRRLRL